MTAGRRAMRTSDRSRAPIFMVGCGRSGTTLAQDLLSRHPDLAWISNYTERWPTRPQLAALARVRRLPLLADKDFYLLPAPREGYRAWNHWGPADPRDRNRPLTEADVGASERQRIRRVAEMHVKYQGARRFFNKNTRNSRRLRYLDAVFPDALFIHVTRDPRAVVASLLKVGFWPDLPLWWHQDKTPSQLVAEGRLAAAIAAEHWRRSVERLLDDKQHLTPSRYLELRYEALVADPVGAMEAVCDFAQLRPSVVTAAAKKSEIRTRNDKYNTQLTSSELELIETIVQPTAQALGYDLAARSAPSGHPNASNSG